MDVQLVNSSKAHVMLSEVCYILFRKHLLQAIYLQSTLECKLLSCIVNILPIAGLSCQVKIIKDHGPAEPLWSSVSDAPLRIAGG